MIIERAQIQPDGVPGFVDDFNPDRLYIISHINFVIFGDCDTFAAANRSVHRLEDI